MSRFDALREGVPDALPSAFDAGDSDSESTMNPHKWEDDRSKTWKERLLPDSPKRRLYLFAVLLAVGGFLLFFLRFVPTAPSALAFVGGVVAAPVAYYHGYRRGYRTMQRMDISVIYNPNSGVRIRAGEFVDTADSDYLLFRPYSAESLAGLQQRYVQLRHVFGSDVAPAKFARGISEKTKGDGVGHNPVIDKLPAVFTSEVNTPAFGRVAVTLTAGLDGRPNTQDYDREAELPDLASREAMREVRSFIKDLTDDLEHLQRRVSRLQERARGRDSELDRRTQEYLDDLTTLMQDLPGSRGRGRGGRSGTSSNGDSADTGGEVDIDAVRDLDEEVADRLEEQHGGDL